MGRGGIPLHPPAGQGPASAAVPLIPGTPDGKMQAGGPLGSRAISPGLMEKLKALRERPVSSAGGIQMGGDDPSAIPQPVREIPEQPSSLDYEQASPKVPEEKKPEEPRRAPDGAGGLLDNVAMTGLEYRANPLLARDDEFLADTWWLSSPERRKELDARSESIDWSGFTTGMDITQVVHMWLTPMVLDVKFRKVKADDEMLARRVLAEHYGRNQTEGELGLLVTTAAASVVYVGERRLPPVPSPLDKNDLGDRMKVFMDRVRIVSTFDMTLLRDLVINYAWFVRRATLDVRGKGKGSLGNG